MGKKERKVSRQLTVDLESFGIAQLNLKLTASLVNYPTRHWSRPMELSWDPPLMPPFDL